MRILVTGARDWPDRLAVYRALNEVCEEFDLNYEPDEYGNTMPDPSKITVVHGDCPTGADHYADQWCISSFMEAERHPADWAAYGKAAGPMRNQQMVSLGADLCLAFPLGGNGTADCMRKAKAAGIQVRVVHP